MMSSQRRTKINKEAAQSAVSKWRLPTHMLQLTVTLESLKSGACRSKFWTSCTTTRFAASYTYVTLRASSMTTSVSKNKTTQCHQTLENHLHGAVYWSKSQTNSWLTWKSRSTQLMAPVSAMKLKTPWLTSNLELMRFQIRSEKHAKSSKNNQNR